MGTLYKSKARRLVRRARARIAKHLAERFLTGLLDPRLPQLALLFAAPSGFHGPSLPELLKLEAPQVPTAPADDGSHDDEA